MAFPGGFDPRDPKNYQLMRELVDWTKQQAEKERREEEDRRDSRIQQYIMTSLQQSQSASLVGGSMGASGLQNPYSPYSYSAYPTYGGIARNGIMQSLSAAWPMSTDDCLPAPDPHKLLTEQISKLQSAEPAKISQRSPDYCQTITSYRGWAVRNEKLGALGQTQAWEPKKAKAAKCTLGEKDHRAPSRDCQCGYWSFKSMDILTEALKSYTSSIKVVGTVEIWGRVIECENGWRSEFAYPKELWLLEPDLEYLSWGYGVPVRKLAGAEKK